MAETVTLSDDTIAAVLAGGKWSSSADDTITGEALPESAVTSLVKAHVSSPDSRQAIAELGLLVLALSAGRWGISWDEKSRPPSPADPDDRHWRGPDRVASGKHLMSYTIGGIGLPHLDRESAVRFFEQVAILFPDAAEALHELSPGFVYDPIRNAGGRTWQLLKKWCLAGLRRREMQVWILTYWINHYWLPAYDAVMDETGGSVEEAFIIGRIWNSSPGQAKAALAAARGKSTVQDRIDAAIENYGMPRRAKVMKRPGAAYAFCKNLLPG